MLWAKRLLLAVSMWISVGCQLDAHIHSQSSKLTVPNSPVQLTYLRGMNLFDLASAGNVIPGVFGTNYTKPNLTFLQNLKNRGHNVVRLPFLWERVQPTLGGSLDAAYLGYIIDVLKDANSIDLKIILDMHNYGGYNDAGKIGKIGGFIGPTQAQFADVWTKLSTALMAEPDAYAAVYAYDIMNEPAAMPDTRGQVPDAGATLLADFSMGTNGWVNDPAATYAHDAQNGGSLKVTAPTSSNPFVIMSINKNFFNPVEANGNDIRVRGYLPDTTSGTQPRVRLSVLKTWTMVNIQTINIEKGYFDVSYNIPSGQWAGVTGMVVEVIVNDAPNSAGPYEFYLYQVSQGTGITGQSPQKLWETLSQAAVTAIRANNDDMTIMVEGYDFASADQWPTNHPTKWITDPKNKTIYQAHQYFDTSAAGTYSQTFADETTDATGSGYTSVADRAVKRVKNFTDWVTAQNVKGYVGELGWPNSDVAPADSAQWDLVGSAVLTHLDSVEMGATLWATGSWLSPTDNILNSYVASPFQVLSPALVLEAHPGK